MDDLNYEIYCEGKIIAQLKHEDDRVLEYLQGIYGDSQFTKK